MEESLWIARAGGRKNFSTRLLKDIYGDPRTTKNAGYRRSSRALSHAFHGVVGVRKSGVFDTGGAHQSECCFTAPPDIDTCEETMARKPALFEVHEKRMREFSHFPRLMMMLAVLLFQVRVVVPTDIQSFKKLAVMEKGIQNVRPFLRFAREGSFELWSVVWHGVSLRSSLERGWSCSKQALGPGARSNSTHAPLQPTQIRPKHVDFHRLLAKVAGIMTDLLPLHQQKA